MPEKTFSWWKFFLALVLVGGLFVVLIQRRPAPLEIIQGPTMGTVFIVQYIPEEGAPDRQEIAQNIKNLLDRANQQMSTYIPSSDISRFNQMRSQDWVDIPLEFARVLAVTLEVAKKSGGALDPTIGPLVNLWGFGPDGIREIPALELIDERLEYVGHDRVIEFDPSGPRLRKLHPKAYLDLSSTAKGYGVDLVSDYLLSVGISHHFVEIGGDLRTRGTHHGRPWRVGIEIPKPDGSIDTKVIEVNDLAPVTSGSYRNFFERNGQIYSHTIDPQTGIPISHNLISATVIDPEYALVSDAWATAFMAMGLESAYRLATELEIAAFFVYFESEEEIEFDISSADDLPSGQLMRNFVDLQAKHKATPAFKAMFAE